MTMWDEEGRRRREISEEVRFHLEGRVAELMAAGMSQADARAEAERRFGDPDAVEAACTEVYVGDRRRKALWDSLGAWAVDLRLAWRGVRRDRGVAAAVVVTLGVALGAVVALFSVADALLLRPLPYPDDGTLVYVWQNDRATGSVREPVGTADFYDFRDRTRSFAGMSMFVPGWATLGIGGEAAFVSVVEAHHDLLDVLGVQPILGRGIRPEETVPGGDAVVLLSQRIWRSSFDADPGVLGQTVAIGEVAREVVGILPIGAEDVAGRVDVWVPLVSTPASATRSPHRAQVVARLNSGASLEGAQVEMTRLAATLEEEVPENANRGAFVEPLTEFLRGDLRTTVWSVLAATVVLLLIATANVTSLLLARAARRQRLTAVHSALGAGPVRTLRRHGLEGLLLAGGAALLGVLVAWIGIGVLEGVAPSELLTLEGVRPNGRVAALTAALVLFLALGLGLVPARQALSQELAISLGHGTVGSRRGRSGGRDLLVAGQAGLATVLLVGAILLGATVRNLLATDLGFRTDDLLRVSLVLPDASYPRDFAIYPNWTEVLSFQERVLQALDQVPGVTDRALMVSHPLDPGFTNSIGVEGRELPADIGELTTRMISPGYFEAAGVDLLAGRYMAETAGPEDPGEVVLNASAARLLFPDGDALGQRIGFWGQGYREIVGVVEDERVAGHRAAAPPAFYTSLLQTPPASNPLLVLVRTEGDPLALAPRITAAVRAIDPAVAVYDVSTMEATLREAVGRERFASTLFGAFAAMAVFLAAIGAYAVLSFAVARRTSEMGVRLALGARPEQLRRRVLRDGLRLVAPGVVGGAVLAFVGSRILESLVYGVSAAAPWVYVSAALLLTGTAAIGALVPAFRASSIEPSSSLRAD